MAVADPNLPPASATEPDFAAPPFDLLDAGQRERLRRSLDIVLYRAGERLIESGQPSPCVYVVLKGRVLASDVRDGAEREFAEYGHGELFGAFAAIAGRARHRYAALEDTLAWTFPAPLFLALTQENPRFAAYFHESLAVKRRLLAERDQPSDLAELMLTRIRDAMVLDAVTVAPQASIAEAVAAMRAGRTDAVLVEDGARRGIATRTDLLDALALGGASPQAPVGARATWPALAVEEHAFLFEALVTMTERHVHRLVVTRDGAVRGTLGLMELLGHFAGKSHVISFRLARARNAADLADLAHELTALVRTLHAQGAKMRFLMELVSALNTRLMARLYELLIPAPVRARACLAVLGSEGRGEQLLKTDQDNALVLADDLQWPEAAAAMTAFHEQLAAMGYPPCPGGVMAVNAPWRRRQADWLAQIEAWLQRPDPAAVMNLAILFDARAVAGAPELLQPLRERLFAAGDGAALRAFAQPVLAFASPLTLFGGVREADGGTDLKRSGVFPIVHGLRTLALAHRIEPRNSFARAEALAAAGVLEAGFARDLMQALSVLLRLRLGEQLDALRRGEPATDLVRVRALRRLDRDLLRDALRVVETFKRWLAARLQLE